MKTAYLRNRVVALARRVRRALRAAGARDGTATHTVSELWGRDEANWKVGGELHWTELEAIKRRISLRVCNNPAMDPWEYVFRAHLIDAIPLDRALTLGCGFGELERLTASFGVIRRHDAFDISDGAIGRARDAARAAGYAQLHYEVADLNYLQLERGAYDCVFGVQSIHHIERLEHLFGQVVEALKPGGHFILNEFVGPTRFQWTDRQLEVINGLLRALPERLRVNRRTGAVKRAVGRPRIADMIRIDPSESIRSAEIVSVLERYLPVVEIKGYGGTVLHMLLDDIAGNFRDAGPTGEAFLESLCDLEDLLIAGGDLTHDFAFIVARKPPSPAREGPGVALQENR